jgi:hypothetical protein
MDPTLSNDYLQRVGREIIRTILERTAKGLDKDRVLFPFYSKEYKESDDFKLTGKSSTVNLRLSNDMLSDLSILDVRKGEIVIGFEDGEQRAKAHGHITGANGTGRLPVRNFLGISDKEMASIMRKIPPPIDYEKAKAEGLKRLGKETLTADDIFNIVKDSIELRLKKTIITEQPDLVVQVEEPQRWEQ